MLPNDWKKGIIVKTSERATILSATTGGVCAYSLLSQSIDRFEVCQPPGHSPHYWWICKKEGDYNVYPVETENLCFKTALMKESKIFKVNMIIFEYND